MGTTLSNQRLLKPQGNPWQSLSTSTWIILLVFEKEVEERFKPGRPFILCYNVQSSGLYTSNATAPKTIVALPDNIFTGLQSPALTSALQTQFRSIELEVSHNLVTKDDIERAAALYLLHDVNLIIKRLLPALHMNANKYLTVFLAICCLGELWQGFEFQSVQLMLQCRSTYMLYRTVCIFFSGLFLQNKNQEWLDQ